MVRERTRKQTGMEGIVNAEVRSGGSGGSGGSGEETPVTAPVIRRTTELGNWEAAIGDYEILRKETPEDEEVLRALSESKMQLVKRRGHES